MEELRIGLKEVEQLYTQFSVDDELEIPDYAIFIRKMRPLYPQSPISVPDYVYFGGNIPNGHPKLRWHTANADGEYLGAYDVIQLIADDQGEVSGLTSIEEYLHYRNKYKKIEMSHDDVKREAEYICKKIGLCILSAFFSRLRHGHNSHTYHVIRNLPSHFCSVCIIWNMNVNGQGISLKC